MRLVVVLLATALLAVGIVRQAWPYVVDDAFISLRYADRLLHGDGLTWTDGEAVEGYSNLLWVLLTAALGALGMDLVTAVRVLGVACTIGTFALLLRGTLLPQSLPARLAVCTFAALTATSLWAVGGLEPPLMMLLLAAAMSFLHEGLTRDDDGWRRSLLACGGALALVCWTRPDGPLWAALAGGVAWLVTPQGAGARAAGRWRRMACIAIPAIAAVLLQLGFRLVYYDDWMPNTGRAKLAGSADARAVGWQYATSAASRMGALLLPAALGVLAFFKARRRATLLFATVGALAWWAYIVQQGGDAFPHGRLLTPALVPLTVLAAHGFDLIAANNRHTRLLATVLAIGSVVYARYDAERENHDPRLEISNWAWSAHACGLWLGEAFGERQPLMAVETAGAMPYASRLPGLDMYGLCDRTIARTPLDDSLPFIAGHTRMNAPYVLSREPDLIMFGGPPGLPYPTTSSISSTRQLEATPEFLRDYRLLMCQTGPLPIEHGDTEDMRVFLWLRLEGRLGARRDGDGVRLPGYLLGTFRQAVSIDAHRRAIERGAPLPDGTPAEVAERNETLVAGVQWAQRGGLLCERVDGETVGRVHQAGEHALVELPLAAGSYLVTAQPTVAGATVALRANRGCTIERVARPDGDAWRVTADGDEPPLVDVVYTVAADADLPHVLRSVELRALR